MIEGCPDGLIHWRQRGIQDYPPPWIAIAVALVFAVAVALVFAVAVALVFAVAVALVFAVAVALTSAGPTTTRAWLRCPHV
jgi:hypothetical protein